MSLFRRLMAGYKKAGQDYVALVRELKPFIKIDIKPQKKEEMQIANTGFTIPLSNVIKKRREKLGLPPIQEGDMSAVKSIILRGDEK